MNKCVRLKMGQLLERIIIFAKPLKRLERLCKVDTETRPSTRRAAVPPRISAALAPLSLCGLSHSTREVLSFWFPFRPTSKAPSNKDEPAELKIREAFSPMSPQALNQLGEGLGFLELSTGTKGRSTGTHTPYSKYPLVFIVFIEKPGFPW